MKDLIGVYDDAVSSEFCQNFMNYMDEMENNSLLVQEEKDRHITDNKVSILSHSYDLAAWSYLGREFFGCMNECVTDYFNTYSILKKDRFLFPDGVPLLLSLLVAPLALDTILSYEGIDT